MDKNGIAIRPATQDDLTGILAIKNYYIINTTAMWYEQPLHAADMETWWAEHAGRGDRPIYVAEAGEGRIVGFASLSDFRSHDGYRFTAEDSVYILPDYTGRRLGQDLLEAAMAAGKRAGLRVVTAWIDAENQASIDFHSRLGFETIGTLRNIGILRGKRRSVTVMDLEL